MSRDIILLDIDDITPGWETYMFSLDTIHPGVKVRYPALVSLIFLTHPTLAHHSLY